MLLARLVGLVTRWQEALSLRASGERFSSLVPWVQLLRNGCILFPDSTCLVLVLKLVSHMMSWIGFCIVLLYVGETVRSRDGADGFVLTLFRDPCSTVDGSGVLCDPSLIDLKFRDAWLPSFCRSVRGVADLEDFSAEVEGGWLPTLDLVDLLPLTGELLSGVVWCKKVTAGSLDVWRWRELKAMPVPWFDGLARILRMVESDGVWPEGLLDVYNAMIPKVDGDATPLCQRPRSVLPVVYRVWASAGMIQLEPWFKSWLPESVFSAGVGRLGFPLR